VNPVHAKNAVPGSATLVLIKVSGLGDPTWRYLVLTRSALRREVLTNCVNIMQKSYRNVIGLPLMTRVPNFTFFKMTDGYGGHTQVLAFFDCAQAPGVSPNTRVLSVLPSRLSRC
jgi:hypothetical protein